MNIFHIYMMHLDEYLNLQQEEIISHKERQLYLHEKLLISGNNRHIITEIMHLHQKNALLETKQRSPHVHFFGLQYQQIQALLQNEVRAAAGHFSNTIYWVNLAAFYYLSFHLAHDLTVVFTKQDEHFEAEAIPHTPYSRFYQGQLGH